MTLTIGSVATLSLQYGLTMYGQLHFLFPKQFQTEPFSSNGKCLEQLPLFSKENPVSNFVRKMKTTHRLICIIPDVLLCMLKDIFILQTPTWFELSL